MNDQRRREVAAAFDTKPDLLPFIPELLADLWALGSTPELIVEWLRPLGLPPTSTRVLDLGCGKGAVALTLASELGFQALGVDFFKPFIQDARKRAEEMGVSGLCQFEVADMRAFLRDAGEFDVAIYASVGSVLGNFDECIGKLRQIIRPGGYMIIHDGFLVEGASPQRSWSGHYAPHEETIRQLTSHGDVLLREKVLSLEEVRAINRRYIDCIRKRTEGLAKRHPEATDALIGHVERQERECELFEKEVVAAVWLLQRT